MRRGRLSKVGGFTLVELMIVIAIIAVLASIAIPQYLKYQRKAKISSYALPLARACAMDIAAFCVEYPGKDFDRNAVQNCKEETDTAGGKVKLTLESIKCAEDGSIGKNGTLVTARIVGINDYNATCEFQNESVRCTVK